MANISNSTSNTVITGTSSADSINNQANNVTINSGNGNDWVRNSGTGLYTGKNIEINTGEGNDTVHSWTMYTKINSGDGADEVHSRGSYSTVDSGAGNDLIMHYPNGGGHRADFTSIFGGEGEDTIWCSYDTSGMTINGGKGNDVVSLTSSSKNDVIEYLNGDGKDTVYGYNSDDTLRIVGSSYSTQNSGTKDILVNVGTGSMLLVDAAGKTLNIIGTVGNDSSVFTEGDDTYRNTTANTLLSALGGNDEVDNYASGVTLYGDGGNDYLYNYATEKVYINGGAGNDTIYNVGSGGNITIDGGTNNDYIWNDVAKLSINGGEGNDTIINTQNSNNVTINAGKGDDVIHLNGHRIANNLIEYTNGDGNDLIRSFGAKSTLKIGNGTTDTYFKSIVGTDILVSVGSGIITLIGAASLSTVNILGTEVGADSSLKYIKLTNKDKSPYNAASGIGTVSGAEERTKAVKIIGNDDPNVLIGGTKSDTLVGGGGVDTFVSGAGKDYVTDYAEGEVVSLAGSLTKAATSGNNVTLTSSKGTMILTGAKGKKVTFVDAKGNTTKQTFGVSAVNVVDGDGATINTTYDTAVSTLNGSTRTEGITLIGNKKDNTIIGGSGDDVLTSGAGKDLFIYTGGNDVITDYAPGKDTIKLEGASITSVSYTGSQSTDLVLTTDKGTLTVENAMSMKSSGGRVVKTPQKLTIIHSDGTTTSQTYQLSAAASGVNTFSGGTGADTIYGFSGNDLLTGGKGKDVFIYGAGNDTITDYTAKQDEIKLNIGSASNYSVNGKDVIFTIDAANSLTVKNGAGKSIKVNGVEKVYKDLVNVVLTNQDANTYTATDSKTMTIDASKRTKAVAITGNANDNTITGGKKNDNLTGGAGADTFVYTNGYGNDVITDYSANDGDIIQLGKNTAVTGVTYSGNDLILTVGKGKITVKGGASQSVTVVDTNDAEMIYRKRKVSSSYEERDFTEPWFAEDNNIITEDVDSILKVDSLSDSKAIGKVSIDYNADTFSIDNQSKELITYSQSRKTFK